jgi:hypothetical protein
MTPYILMWFIIAGNGQGQIGGVTSGAIEFKNRDSCMAASWDFAQKVSGSEHNMRTEYICVPKDLKKREK